MIGVVDYGGGNLCSVLNALRRLGTEAETVSDPARLAAAEKIVLPGVGAFGDAVRSLRASCLIEPIRRAIADGKPFFGICLGMQLLYDASEESPDAAGLSVFSGTVKKFPPADKIPHIGWNDLSGVKSGLLREKSYVYFVHGYYVPVGAETAAKTSYAGVEFASAVERGSVFAAQFHPEKSGDAGIEILRRFLRA